MTLARFIWKYYRRHLGWALIAVLSTPIYGASSAAVVALIEPIFRDVLLAGEAARDGVSSEAASGPVARSVAPRRFDVKGWADRGYESAKRIAGVTRRGVVYFTPLLLCAFFILRGAADFAGGYAFQRVALGVTTSISNDLQRKLLDQSSVFHARHPSGELVSRVVNDVSKIQSALSSRVFDLCQQSLTLVLLVGLLLSTDLALGLLVILGVPLFAFFLFRLGKTMRRLSHRNQVRMAEVVGRLSESIRGHAVIQAYGAEELEHQRFAQANARYLRACLRVERLNHLSPLLIESVAIATTAGFLIYAGFAVRAGRISGPLLVQFIANVLLLYDPLRKLNKANFALQQAMAVGYRVKALFDEPIEIVERPDAVAVTEFRDRIAFENVSLAFGARTILDDVTLEVRRGESIALVGPSGAGKSTLVSLLPRFLDPQRGRVTLDGRDVRDITIASLRALIAFTPQRTFVFDDTIRGNIAVARPDAPIAHIQSVARTAAADGFIRARPDEYETRVGESGRLLSGGERQRIAIARALLKDAPILIFDESTSELDSESEAAVGRALRSIMRGRTALIVAHRLTTARQADRIVVLENGRVVETGRHHDLLARGGTYRRLHDHWTRHEKR